MSRIVVCRDKHHALGAKVTCTILGRIAIKVTMVFLVDQNVCCGSVTSSTITLEPNKGVDTFTDLSDGEPFGFRSTPGASVLPGIVIVIRCVELFRQNLGLDRSTDSNDARVLGSLNIESKPLQTWVLHLVTNRSRLGITKKKRTVVSPLKTEFARQILIE